MPQQQLQPLHMTTMTTDMKLWMGSDEEREERKKLKEKRQRQLKKQPNKPQKKPLMLPTPTLLLKIHMLQPPNLQPLQLLQLQSIQHQSQYTQLKDQTNQINLIPDMLP